jgi:hypothetical protein
MKYNIIAHRGNIKGPNPKKENSLSYINAALNEGYGCEIDVWYDKGWWLGHDKPQHKTTLIWLATTCNLWVHCKNLKAMEQMSIQHINHFPNVPHYFWHENDTVALTNRGLLWTFPRRPLTGMSICVLPELGNYTDKELMKALGICTDLCDEYKKMFMKKIFINKYGRRK